MTLHVKQSVDAPMYCFTWQTVRRCPYVWLYLANSQYMPLCMALLGKQSVDAFMYGLTWQVVSGRPLLYAITCLVACGCPLMYEIICQTVSGSPYIMTYLSNSQWKPI